jgi:uncharacterized damage-inducible protein DinB
MTITDMQLLFDYYYWATEHILDATEKITLEQFIHHDTRLADQDSLRATLVHTLNSERIWRMRWQGQSKESGTELTEDAFPTLTALRVYWRQQEQEMRTFLAMSTEADLIRHIEGVTAGGIHYVDLVWHSMLQVLFHGAQHRSEAAAMLTAYGSSPGDMDFFLFLRQQR